MKQLILLLCLACGSAPAAVYKCASAGKLSYSDRPCAGGTELAVPRTPAPDPQAARDLARQKAMLAQLVKERQLREAKDERAYAQAARAAAVRNARCAKLRLHKKWADENAARAAGQGKEALRTKARRQGELMALECPS